MKEIGGYFEIEFSNVNFESIHKDAIRLNTARNCLEYILLANNYKKIFLPYYTCDVVLEPIIKHQISYEFYYIDENLEPLNIPPTGSGEAFLYTNYFGIKDEFCRELAGAKINLIIDNSQALFALPISQKDTFYSLRKFVGVADGAFLYCRKKLASPLEKSSSAERISHLYNRKDINASFGYNTFVENDKSLSGLPIAEMSNSTEAFLKTYDFEKNKITRERNFLYLHHYLQQYNELDIDITHLNAPLCYPFLNKRMAAKSELVSYKIYIPTYWTNVLEWVNTKDAVEQKLVNFLLPLPIDQRYSLEDLHFMIGKLLK